ncbi:hypothetical protein EWT54_24245 [Escherichia coli O25b:H4]|nr:hypothetical protein EWT54_24245 [Escherichia coli O25b:H4]
MKPTMLLMITIFLIFPAISQAESPFSSLQSAKEKTTVLQDLRKTVFCKNGDITNPELSGGKMPDAGRNMTWDLRAPAPTPSHLRATVAIKGSFRGAEF